MSMTREYSIGGPRSTALLPRAAPGDDLPVSQAHIARKVQWVFETLGVSRALVMRRCGLQSKSAITGWMRTGRIAKTHLPVLAELSGTTLEWWHDEQAAVPPNPFGLVSSQKSSQFPHALALEAHPVSHLPRKLSLTVAVRCAACLSTGEFVETELASGSVEFASDDPDAFAVRCVGDEMAPRIEHGEFVVIEPGRAPLPGRDVYVRTLDGKVAIRRLAYERDGRVFLECVNKRHPAQAISIDQIAAIHPVVARVESFRFTAEP